MLRYDRWLTREGGRRTDGGMEGGGGTGEAPITMRRGDRYSEGTGGGYFPREVVSGARTSSMLRAPSLSECCSIHEMYEKVHIVISPDQSKG